MERPFAFPEKMDTVIRALPGVRDLLPLAAANPQRYPCLFESAAGGGTQARYDMLLAFPQEALTLGADGRVRGVSGDDCGRDFLGALDAAWRRERVQASSSRRPASSSVVAHDAMQGIALGSALAEQLPPFRGGWAVLLGYELAAQVEPRLRLPAAADAALPVALALRCPAAIIVDREAQRTLLMAEAKHAECIETLNADLDSAPACAPPQMLPAVFEEDPPARFLDGVARIHEYLHAGDTFQVNLSREWRLHYAVAPPAATLYASLRVANPAPFAALLQWQDWAIASSSPERLVETRNGRVQTRPIAGTRPRLHGEDDAARIRELIDHPKERAEHVMLIDLERNDLGRVCVPGSIRVDELMTVESYAHVHHIVSNVSGKLCDGASPGDVLRAVFPGGTVTGCPKLRTMEIIAELEGVGRGAYTGALGYINCDGDMDFNILIRSLTLRGANVRLRAGAGIVVDSVPARELEETRAKARGLLRACGAPA
jgi:anthranilate synthase component 1